MLKKWESKISECVCCGKCLSVCPTYKITKNELYSPRGRLNVLKFYNRLPEKLSYISIRKLALCTLCGLCCEVCPSELPITDIFHDFFSELVKRFPFILKRFASNEDIIENVVLKTIKPFKKNAIVRKKSEITQKTSPKDILIATPLLLNTQNSWLSNVEELLYRSFKTRFHKFISIESPRKIFFNAVPRDTLKRFSSYENIFFTDEEVAFLFEHFKTIKQRNANLASPASILTSLIKKGSQIYTRGNSFCILPPSIPFTMLDIDKWNENFKYLEKYGMFPFLKEWIQLKAEFILPMYHSISHKFSQMLINSAILSGVDILVASSFKTYTWIKNSDYSKREITIETLPGFVLKYLI